MKSLKEKVIINWSGGKDSALALYKLIKAQEYKVMYLLTSVNEEHQRISMHGVRQELLQHQAESIGFPLKILQTPEMPSMEVYENLMYNTLQDLKSKGATASMYGDIFLEDLRIYRESELKKVALKPIFPLWNSSTKSLIKEFIDLGFKTITVCVNAQYLDKSFVGRVVDNDFINDLPENVDACGENGEFHTFVFDGPIFKKPISFDKGEVVYKTYKAPKLKDNSSNKEYLKNKTKGNDSQKSGFWFCDLIPKSTNDKRWF